MKILIYQKDALGSTTDVSRKLNYEILHDEVKQNCNHVWTNSGNKIWMQGIISELSTNDNEIRFLKSEYTWDFINEYFDAIVYSTANLIQRRYKEAIREKAEDFRKSKIPVYVISCGAQGNLGDSPREVAAGIEGEIASFLDSIYSTGGELGLRGAFTKDVLDSVMQNTAKVTGCPSLFQNGKNLTVSNQKVDFESFRAAINGDMFLYKGLITEKSIFMDQNTFAGELLDVDMFDWPDEVYIKHCTKKFGTAKTELLLQGKIRLFMDVPEWMGFLEKQNISFSFGSRIHGNILPILGGIPALIHPIDSRTMEMAAFFNIPQTHDIPKNMKSLYEMYLHTDYSGFNKKFGFLYDNYNQFIVDCGLVKNKINTDNVFWNREAPYQSRKILERKAEILDYFNKNYGRIWLEETIWRLLRHGDY